MNWEEELDVLVERYPSAVEAALDELVHTLKSGEASVINNGGREAQLEYLLEGMSGAEILKSLREGDPGLRV